MHTPENITVVTVTYDQEYPLLLIQANSIIQYMRPEFVREIVWIVNHAPGEYPGNEAYLYMAASRLLRHGFALRIIPRGQFGLENHTQRGSGWRHQQALKLLVSGLVSTPHYLLLDTKNFLTRPVDAGTLFRNGKAISSKTKCPTNLRPWLEASARAVGCDIDGAPWFLPTVTPYLMHAATVREMIAAHGGPGFAEFFYSHKSATEFYLYFCYMKKHGLIETLYELVPQFYATYFAGYPATPEQMESVGRNVESPNTFCVSFHRQRFVDCAPSMRDYITGLWSRHGLVCDAQQADAVFSAMAG